MKILILIFLLITILSLSRADPYPRACDKDPAKSMDFCNANLDLKTRVTNLIQNLTQDEKLSQFMNTASPIPRLNIFGYQWWNEALHGVAGSPGVNFDGPIKSATSFPISINSGATFNRSLWQQVTQVISTEARAMNNQGQALFTFWSPVINIYRDPRWGRGQETPGEDPYLTGQYSQQFVKGMQEGEDPKHLKVSSLCKHYFDYNLENWVDKNGATYIRYTFDAITPTIDLADSYMPGWQACIERAGTTGLMCSYNAVNGVPTCANHDYMTKLARQTWGFDGYITGDCGAVGNVQSGHHYTKSDSETVKVTLESGVDQDCGDFLKSDRIKKALDDKSITIDTIDTALEHQFMVWFRLGMFDPVQGQPYLTYGVDKVNTPYAQQLALEFAKQSFVLLKNQNNYLPQLINNSTNLKIGFFGPNADATSAMQGSYSGNAPYLISPIQGFQKKGFNISLAKGCNDVKCANNDFSQAIDLAKSVDIAIVVVGLDTSVELEMLDRLTLLLPGNQQQLVQNVSQYAKNTILVIMGAGPIDVSVFKNDDKIQSIIWIGYPSQSGGEALADVILGRFSPSGRLPVTWYPQSYNDVNMTNVGMRPDTASGYPGRTYRFYTGTPVYEFGYGLSYSKFSYSLQDKKDRTFSFKTVDQFVQRANSEFNLLRDFKDNSNVPFNQNFTIRALNNGNFQSSETILAFVRNINGGTNGLPLKTLIGFEKVELEPNQYVDVHFNLTPLDVAIFQKDGSRATLPGKFYVDFGVPRQITVLVTVQPQKADETQQILK